jgi:protein SCO1/2
MKKTSFYLIFFLVLLLGFWWALNKYTPWFSQSKLAERGIVQPFHFTNQDSISFTNADMAGKVCVVEYFFTTCAGICPKMNKNMKDIFETFKTENDFLIVSHTCQPEFDSVALLKAYSKKMNADNIHWIFVTGSKDSLYNIARFSYGIDDPKNAVSNIKDDFLHSQFFALVDKTGNVRGGVYDGLKKDEIEKLKRDVKSLLKEKSTNGNFRGVFNN